MSARGKRGNGTIEQRGGYWYWRRSGIDSAGRRKQFRDGPFPSKESAEAVRSTAAPMISIEAATCTWAQWFDEWLPAKLHELESAERETYGIIIERVVRLHLRPRIGGLRLAATTPKDIDLLLHDLLNTAGLKRRYVKNIRGNLNGACNDAIRAGMMVNNPIRLAKLPQLHRGRVDDATSLTIDMSKVLGVEQIQSLVTWIYDNMSSSPWPLPTLVVLDTGARRGEALGIRWSDVDLERSTLSFVQQVVQPKSKSSVRVGPLKTAASRRTVAIGPRLVAALAEHQRRSGGIGDRLVFARPDGSMPVPESFTGWFRKVCRKQVGLPENSTLHGLRHTHASHLLAAGETDIAVCARLGHSSTVITRIVYQHSVPAAVDGIGIRWEALLNTDDG